jgi:UDP-N-acetyl-D-mannosaminuronate dehydrogenase
MLTSAQMDSETAVHVKEASYFSLSSKHSCSRNQFDEEYYPATPPTEELEEYVSTESPRIFTAVKRDSEPLVVVMGVGYVGSHLIDVFSAHYNVLGFDISEKRIQEVSVGYRESKRVRFTTSMGELAAATHFLISVPTLLLPDRTIDSSYLRSALKAIEKYGRTGATVVIESSVAVGMTRQLLGPMAATRNFFAGMSPEVRHSNLSKSESQG